MRRVVCSPGSGTAGPGAGFKEQVVTGTGTSPRLGPGWGAGWGGGHGGMAVSRPLKGHLEFAVSHGPLTGYVRATCGVLRATYGLLAMPYPNVLDLRPSYGVWPIRTPYGTYGTPPSAADGETKFMNIGALRGGVAPKSHASVRTACFIPNSPCLGD